MFWAACIYLLVCMYVCMLPTFLKNYWTELHEIFRDDLHHPRTNRLDFGSDTVKVTKRSKTYFCHNTLSFCRIHVKPAPKCSLFNSLSSDMLHEMVSSSFIGLFVCMYVCMLPTFLKNYWTELHEIFKDDLSSSKNQSIRFWERSGQRSRSRKGQKLLNQIA